jgi:hypothetical protein
LASLIGIGNLGSPIFLQGLFQCFQAKTTIQTGGNPPTQYITASISVCLSGNGFGQVEKDR